MSNRMPSHAWIANRTASADLWRRRGDGRTAALNLRTLERAFEGARRGLTIAQMMAITDRSRSQVYRYLDDLHELGLPLVQEDHPSLPCTKRWKLMERSAA